MQAGLASSATTGSSSSTSSPVLEGSKGDYEGTTPLTSASPETPHAPSPNDAFSKWANVAKEAHYKRAHIFGRTRQMMRLKSHSMLVTGSRGYARSGHVPTKHTEPRLLRRRYSVDVLTVDGYEKRAWNKMEKTEEIEVSLTALSCSRSLRVASGSSNTHGHVGLFTDLRQVSKSPAKYDEAEPIAQKTLALPLPDQRRYPAFGHIPAIYPPNDMGVYLELGNAVLHNEYYYQITDCSYPNAWMHDEILNTAIEVLRRDEDCDRYSIGFADSNTTQLFQIARGSNDTDSHHYDSYREQFGDKAWVFLIINDGAGSEGQSGSHWSLVAVDRIHKRAHYIDSLFVYRQEYQDLGREISLGLLEILGEDIVQWKYKIETNSPNQNWNNQFNWDAGACGPAVYKIIQLLVWEIKRMTVTQRVHECFLSLPDTFKQYFEDNFHSLHVRHDIAGSLILWKVKEDSKMLNQQHDEAIVKEEDVMLLDTPDITSFGRRPSSLLPEGSEADTEQALEEGYDDEPNHIVIEESDDGMQSDSTASTDPAEEITLDDDNVFLDRESSSSPHNRHQHRPRRSRSVEVRDEATWGIGSLINGDDDDVETHTTPTVRRTRVATPFRRTGGAHEMYGMLPPRRRDSDTWSTDANYWSDNEDE